MQQLFEAGSAVLSRRMVSRVSGLRQAIDSVQYQEIIRLFISWSQVLKRPFVRLNFNVDPGCAVHDYPGDLFLIFSCLRTLALFDDRLAGGMVT